MLQITHEDVGWNQEKNLFDDMHPQFVFNNAMQSQIFFECTCKLFVRYCLAVEYQQPGLTINAI